MIVDRQELTKRLIAWAAAQEAILALYLFGSLVEGRANVLSDVDVAVLAQYGLAKEHLWHLEDQWSAEWPEWVDLHVLNLAPPAFQFEVITRGQRLWARDVSDVAEYESLTRRRYWDLRPMLERDWAAFRDRLLEQQDEAERKQYQEALAKIRAVHRRVREASSADT